MGKSSKGAVSEAEAEARWVETCAVVEEDVHYAQAALAKSSALYQSLLALSLEGGDELERALVACRANLTRDLLHYANMTQVLEETLATPAQELT